MEGDPDGSAAQTAHDALERFGLSSYAAGTFLALAENGQSTARAISQSSEVPRTRVYDAIEELEEWGLVETVEESPKEFRALDVRRTSRRLGKEYDRRASELTLALLDVDEIRSATRPLDSGVGNGGLPTDVDVADLVETVLDGESETRVFVITDRNGDDLPVVYLPGENGNDPELRVLSPADSSVADD